MKRRSPMIYVQTFGAVGFGIFFIILSFVAHPANVTFALPILIIGVVLIAVGLAGLLFGILRSRP